MEANLWSEMICLEHLDLLFVTIDFSFLHMSVHITFLGNFRHDIRKLAPIHGTPILYCFDFICYFSEFLIEARAYELGASL
jgi:hypothetical protein